MLYKKKKKNLQLANTEKKTKQEKTTKNSLFLCSVFKIQKIICASQRLKHDYPTTYRMN